MARIKLTARIGLPDRCTCDEGLKDHLGETDQPCATEIAYRAQIIDPDVFTSNDRRALPFALERIQSLLKQFNSGYGGHQNMDSDLAVVLRAAKHMLQTSVDVDESSTAVATISPSSSISLPAVAAAAASPSSSSSPSILESLLPVSTPTERSLARVASLVAVGDRTGCGSAIDRAHLASYRRELTPVEKFIVPQLQATDELNEEEFEYAKKRLVSLEQMNTTQTVPRLHLALAQLFGEPSRYSIVDAVFRVTRHIAMQEQQNELSKQDAAYDVYRRQYFANQAEAANQIATSAASSSSTAVPLNYPHIRGKGRKASDSMKEQPPAKRLCSTMRA